MDDPYAPMGASTAQAADPYAPMPAAAPSHHGPQLPKHLAQRFDNAVGQAGYMFTHPVELMGAIGGTFERGLLGAVVGAGQQHHAKPRKAGFGTAPVASPAGQWLDSVVNDTLGGALGGITHPGAQIALTRNAERTLHLKPIHPLAALRGPAQFLGELEQQIPSTGGVFNLHNALHATAGAARKVAGLSTQQGLDAAVQGAADLPTYFAPELDATYLAFKGGSKAVPAVAKRLLGHENFENLQQQINPFHGVNQTLHAPEAARVRGEAAIARNQARQGSKRAEALVTQHRQTLEQLPQMFHGEGSRAARRRFLLANPQTAPVVHELDRGAWIEGTQSVRDSMVQHGYKPDAELATMPPGNTLHHWDENYFPTQAIAADQKKGLNFGSWRKSKSNAAGYNLKGGEGTAEDNAVEQVRQRLIAGHRNAANAQLQRRTIRAAQQGARPGVEMSELNLNSKDAGGKPTGNIFQSYPEAVQKATLRDIKSGESPYLAFDPMQPTSARVNADITRGSGSTPYLREPIPIYPLKAAIKRRQAALDRAQSAEANTREGTSQFGLGVQKRVSDAANEARGKLAKDTFGLAGKADRAAGRVTDQADDLRTKLHLRDRAQVDRLLKARGDDISSPLAKRIATVRDQLERRGGGDFVPIRQAPKKIAEQAGKLAGDVMEGKYHSAIHDAALGGSVDRILRGTKQQQERATKELLHAQGKLAAASRVNETVDRVSKLVDDELAKTGNVQIPKAVEDFLYNRATAPSFPVLPELANIFRDATFAIPYVHGWNLTQQTLMHGLGPGVVKRGMEYARKLANNDPAALKSYEELQRLGQAAEYATHNAPAFGNIPKIGPHLAEMSRKGQETLDHIDHGLKLAAMEHFKKTEKLTGAMLGARLEDVYGNPEASFLAQMVRGLGGFFGQWRLNTLPRTVSSALRSEKGRKAIHTMNAAQNFLTQESEYRPNHEKPREYNLFPAVNEAQQLIFGGPVGASKYLTSSGTLGVIPELMRLQKEKGTKALSEIAAGTAPYAPIAQMIVDLKKQDPSLTAEDVLSIIGPRVTRETGTKALDAAYKQKLKYLPQHYPGVEALP